MRCRDELRFESVHLSGIVIMETCCVARELSLHGALRQPGGELRSPAGTSTCRLFRMSLRVAGVASRDRALQQLSTLHI